MNLNLVSALFALALWVIFTFIRPIGLGVVHLLLGAGAVLWVMWWATREKLRQRSTVNGQQDKPS